MARSSVGSGFTVILPAAARTELDPDRRLPKPVLSEAGSERFPRAGGSMGPRRLHAAALACFRPKREPSP